MVRLVEHDHQLPSGRVEEGAERRVVLAVGPHRGLERTDHHVVSRLDGCHAAVPRGAGDDAGAEPLLRFANLADLHLIGGVAALAEAVERLLEEVVSMGEPKHLVSVAQRIATEETNGGEGLSAAGRQHQEATCVGVRRRLVPRAQLRQGLPLV